MNSKTQNMWLILCVLTLAFAVAACGREGQVSEGPSGEISDIPGEVPARYRDLINPLMGDTEALVRGREAYQALCSQCHGVDGRGDGSEAVGFNPGPGDLTRNEIDSLSDGYLFWRVAEGGAIDPFNSLMPAWGSLLSDTEIWELISYMRDLSR